MATKIELMQNCGLDVDRLQKCRIGSPNLLLEAVRQGLGVTIFNEHIARHEMVASGIAIVPLPKKAECDYLALMPKGLRHSLAMPFVNWVKTLF